ncbi:hypothetical protein [Primorskyibacter sp. S87]|uniref:hypothetical protein n=1 Tax=Primorskyibacter sp. S87 TaxID=3415126 RepID=UPI003C7A9647
MTELIHDPPTPDNVIRLDDYRPRRSFHDWFMSSIDDDPNAGMLDVEVMAAYCRDRGAPPAVTKWFEQQVAIRESRP